MLRPGNFRYSLHTRYQQIQSILVTCSCYKEFYFLYHLLSVTIGASVGGILGMLIATPLCSLLYILLRQAVNDRINSNKIVNRVKEKV